MERHALLNADELALFREQFERQDALSPPELVTFELPGFPPTASETLYLVRKTDNLEFRYPLQVGGEQEVSLGIPFILEKKGLWMRDLRVHLPGCVHNPGDQAQLRLVDISMSGCLVFHGNAARLLNRVQIELSGNQRKVVLEADVQAVSKILLWHQWAVAYRFVSLKQGAESLRQLIYDCHQQLCQN